MSDDALRALAGRLRALAHPTDDGRFSVSRLFGRLAKTPTAPRIETARLVDLVNRIDLSPPEHLAAQRVEPDAALFANAVGELHLNVRRAERTLFVHGRLPDGHLDRLWRLYQVAHRAAKWIGDPLGWRPWRELLRWEAQCAIAPLQTDPGYGAPSPIHGVDALIGAADAETRAIGRQRRLLEAARQQLLEASAAVRLDRAGLDVRRVMISRRIARLDRLEAAGISPDVDLGYQLREAAERGEVQRLFAALAALEEGGFRAGDAELNRLAGRAADALWGTRDGRMSTVARANSLQASQDQMFGAELRSSIDRAYKLAGKKLEEARVANKSTRVTDLPVFTDAFLNQWERYFTLRATHATLAAAVAADGCFDVGGTSSPVRAAGEARRPALVPFPQQEMVLEPLGGVTDVSSAVIVDPRAVLLDLAAGRLLARRYLGAWPNRDDRPRMQNEVRVYVLDGSSSMLGPRARVRDALLLAELSTLAARLQDGDRSGNPVLYYRYFNDTVGDTRRVASIEETESAVEDVLAAVRNGETDIQGALLASFEQIRVARAEDPDLARAQIVLVTDGDAPIKMGELRAAREKIGEIPVGVSIIALGTENPDLRKLASIQRAAGERTFYQFVDDEELRNMVEGLTAGLPIHLPAGADRKWLTEEIGAVLADIQRHLRRIDADQIERAREMPAALTEVGLSPETGFEPWERARIAALENDRTTLEAAFVRAFPIVAPPGPGAAEALVPARWTDGSYGAEVLAALATVAEVVETFGTGPVERQADAIELLQRLLAEAHVPPWDYARLVTRPSDAVKGALRAVHAASRFAAVPSPA